jgi:pilus assembly protein Flp/PilA
MKLLSYVLAFVREEEGQDLIEYALLVALISLVCVAALMAAGTQVNTIFGNIRDRLTTADDRRREHRRVAPSGREQEGGGAGHRGPASREGDMANTLMHTLTVARQYAARAARDERGQDLIEYALLTAMIAMVAFAAVTSVGTTVRDVFWAAIAAGMP